MKVKWDKTDWGYGYEFIFYTENHNQDIHICTDIQGGRMTFHKHEMGSRIEIPTLRLEGGSGQEFIQSFLDEAWDKGFRPTKEKKTREQVEKEMERLEDHLEDMRSLVFHMMPEEMRTYPEEISVSQRPIEFYKGLKKGDIE